MNREKFKLFYNKFIDNNCIFKEDIYLSLVNILDFEEEDASYVCKCISELTIDKDEKLMNILNRNMGNESYNFIVFLNILRNKLIVSKSISNVIETSYIQLIDNLTALTGGYIIYPSQLDVVLQTIGRSFMWDKIDNDKCHSSVYIKDFISYNMAEYYGQYPLLVDKLLHSIDALDLEKDTDLFKECSVKKNLLVNLKRNSI